jgi:hypothetical protein
MWLHRDERLTPSHPLHRIHRQRSISRRCLSERQCQRLTNPIAVEHRAIRELSEGHQRVDFGRPWQSSVKTQARSLACLVGGLPLTMTRALRASGPCRASNHTSLDERGLVKRRPTCGLTSDIPRSATCRHHSADLASPNRPIPKVSLDRDQ